MQIKCSVMALDLLGFCKSQRFYWGLAVLQTSISGTPQRYLKTFKQQ